jgi:choline dehydrogenase
MNTAIPEVDYIIVGAGSAGCVLANRLTESGDASVLLIEAGGRDINPFIHMPAGIAKLVDNPRIDWRYYTEPEPELAGRRLYWPRGKVLGGSSSINAMCYVRGAAADYDDWRDAGLDGWGYADVLGYFRKSEHQARGASEYHGVGGPLSVEDLRFRNPLSSVFVDAALAAGWSRNDDFNGPSQPGFGFYQVTQRSGRRCSTAVGYLRPTLRRPNLRVLRKATVLRVLLEHGRAVGVEYVSQNRRAIVRATREVLLSAGTVGSPQLLLLSGIGPPQDLHEFGVPIQLALPGVGRNLQDHLDFCTLYKCTRKITYDFGRLQEAAVGLRFLLTSSGPGVSNVAEAGGFARSRFAIDARADLQFHFVPAQLDDHGRNRLPGHGFTVHACMLRPRSRGYVTLRSASPADPPRIFAGYLSAGEDLQHLIEGVRLSRDIVAASPFATYRGAEVFPGSAAVSDAQLQQVVRQKAESIYHPVGTCRMGVDELAVVDANLCVRGAQGLRVVDASIMPQIVGGNTNAPTIMIAEKAADLIRGTC